MLHENESVYVPSRVPGIVWKIPARSSFPGGNQQKVVIAKSLVQKPRLITLGPCYGDGKRSMLGICALWRKYRSVHGPNLRFRRADTRRRRRRHGRRIPCTPPCIRAVRAGYGAWSAEGDAIHAAARRSIDLQQTQPVPKPQPSGRSNASRVEANCPIASRKIRGIYVQEFTEGNEILLEVAIM